MSIPAIPDMYAQQGWIGRHDTGDIIPFKFMPDEISDSKQPNWNAIEIIGRSHPIQGYASSSPRTISCTLYLYKMDEGQDVYLNASELRMLCYPRYGDGGLIRPPPLCNFVAGRIKMTGVITSCDITYRSPWTFANSGGGSEMEPMYAEVALSFTEAGPTPWDMEEVLLGRDFINI